MINLVLGFAVVAGLWWLSGRFTRANPAALARLIRTAGGAALLVAAAGLMLRGRLDAALLVGGLGAWLLGWQALRLPGGLGRLGLGRWGLGPLGFGGRTRGGATSRVRSALIEMELDHGGGRLTGTVLAGPLAGRSLDELGAPALLDLRRLCRAHDADGAGLLEAYLDRRFPRWREHAEFDADAGPRPRAQPGAVTEEEAYQILGLERGAALDEVRRAHRTLMKKLHPDQGGSDYLAARVNAAKDVLLNRHR